MHGSVLQNKKYIKFHDQNTVEVMSLGSLQSGIDKGDKRAGTYLAKDAAGNVARYLDALGVTVAQAETAHLITVLGGGFPELDGGQLAALIDAAGLAPSAA